VSKLEPSELVTSPKLPNPQTEDAYYRRLGVIVLAVVAGIIIIWGVFAPLSSSVAASGKVGSATSNRLIQHLEPGIVKSILVKDGDRVAKGDTLIVIDDTQSKQQLELISADYFSDLAKEARLIAESNGMNSINFSKELYENADEYKTTLIMEGQKRELTARARQLADDKEVLKQRIDQYKHQISGLEALIDTKSVLSGSYGDETSELDALYKEQLIDKMRLRDLKREKLKNDSDLANAKSELARAKSQILETEAQLQSEQQTFMKNVLAELSDTQSKLADGRARMIGLKDTLERTVITAPVSGTVTKLQIHTIGGVIASGTALLEIVPLDDALIIDAKVQSTDINNLHVGLKAEIRFPGFAHIKALNVVKGEVTTIAADAITDEKTGTSYYPVEIKVTADGQKELAKNNLSIQPGMPAEAMIVVKSRTFLDYLIQPLKQMFARAFNEQ
jgi:membrane fusion protein, epimerase transport system